MLVKVSPVNEHFARMSIKHTALLLLIQKYKCVSCCSHQFHSCFKESANVFDHQLSIKANRYLPVDETAVVTGMLLHIALNTFTRIPNERLADVWRTFGDNGLFDTER